MRKLFGLNWSWQNLFDGQPWWKHSRAWAYLEHHTVGIEWVARTRDCALSVSFRDGGENSLQFHAAIPFLISFWISVHGLRWVTKLPGVNYTEWRTGSRELGFYFHGNALWVSLWSHPDEYPRRGFTLHFDDLLLGKCKYSEAHVMVGTCKIMIDDGEKYAANWKLYTAQWKRPRWPWPKRIRRGDIDVLQGVPIPGKGDNDWDQSDDAVYSFTVQADNLDDLVHKFRNDIWDTRVNRGGPDWKPEIIAK